MINDWIYENDKENTARYILGESGSKYLACIGINPSTAIPEYLDNTLKSVKRMAIRLGYTGWLMFNVYPKRCTIFNNLEREPDIEIFNKNIQRILYYCESLKPDIWCAWGGLVVKRKYLIESIKLIIPPLLEMNLKIFQSEKISKHPHHPLYLKNNSKLIDFNILEYLKNFI